MNGVAVGDSYLFMQIEECSDVLGVATVFSCIHANRGDWLIKEKESDREKMTVEYLLKLLSMHTDEIWSKICS